jgi:tetratricopeptide (TPR) repeat protein
VRRILAAALVLTCTAAPANSQIVAALPFTNATALTVPDADGLDWIGESIAWTIREAFFAKNAAALDRAPVQEAYRSLRLRPFEPLSTASILKLGDALDAEQIIYGSFAFVPSAQNSDESLGTLKITAHLLDRRRLRSGPDFTDEGRLEDLASLELHMAWRCLNAIAPKAAPAEANYASLRQPMRLDAEESYVRGLMATAEEQEKLFRQAATIDPRFASPNLQLGKLAYQRKQYREAVVWLAKITPASIYFRDATFFSGLSRYQMGDFVGAQTAFQTIAVSVPLNEVWNNLAAAESRRALPQAVDHFRIALEGDPNDTDYHFNLGLSQLKRGDYSAAADQFRAVLERTPDDSMATLLLGRSLKRQPLRLADPKSPDFRFASLERLKTNYEERAYWHLMSVLEPKAE